MNEKIAFENNNEKFGKKVELKISFLRHAPADKETCHLTKTGLDIAKQAAESMDLSDLLETNESIFKAYSSDMDRAKETAQAITNSVKVDKKGNVRVSDNLGEKKEDFRIPIEDLKLPYSQYLNVYKNKKLLGEESISLHDLAQRIAKRTQHFIEMSKKLKNNSKANLVNITHIPWIPAFLKELLKEKINSENSKEILEADYLKGFEVSIKRNGEDVKLNLIVGQKEFEITEEEIDSIIND